MVLKSNQSGAEGVSHGRLRPRATSMSLFNN
jgi:hypothetical protein